VRVTPKEEREIHAKVEASGLDRGTAYRLALTSIGADIPSELAALKMRVQHLEQEVAVLRGYGTREDA
jgi:hypothetical protein